MSRWSVPLILVAFLIAPLFAADDEPSLGEVVDHPLLVVAGASLDRVLDRAVDVLQANGLATTRDDVVTMLRAQGHLEGGIEGSEKWFDATKPVGLMFFFGMSAAPDPEMPEPPARPDDVPPDKQADDDAESDEDATGPVDENAAGEAAPPGQALQEVAPGLESALESLSAMNLNRIVVFIPVKDYRQFLAEGKLTSVAGKANCFRDDKGKESYLRRIGDYVLGAHVPDLVEHCPDPRGLARAVLGKNDVAVSLQLKGLPPLLRTLGAEGIKAAYDASLQQRDDEPQREYQLRRATGDLVRELLELLVSHIDEVTLGARIDPKSKQTVFDLDFVGEKGGDLAKLAAELAPRRVPFEGLWNPAAELSLAVSLSLPERHTKPIAAAVRNYIATPTEAEREFLQQYGTLVEAGCKILDARQFDFVMTGGDGADKCDLMAISIPGGPRFPEQFQQILQPMHKDGVLSVAADEINGWPVHRLLAPMGLISFMSDGELEGSTVTKEEHWIVATPQAVWIGSAPKNSEGRLPEFMRTMIAAQSKRPTGSAKGPPGNIPFRMALHTRNWVDQVTSEIVEQKDEAAEARKLRLELAEKEELRRTEFKALYEEQPDAITVELRPSPTGGKLSVQLDKIYLRLIWRLMQEWQ